MALPRIQNLDSMAAMLGIPKFMLTRYIFLADMYYKQFRIPKKSRHGYRKISAPSKELKGIQRWIVAFILRKIDVSMYCTAFRPNCSIIKNAKHHLEKDFVYNTDIADFFPSITINRVVGFFKGMGYSKTVSFALGKLMTYRGRLPQGAPSSPEMANIIGWKIDKRLLGLCQKRGWNYSRYCDDITISGEGRITKGIELLIEKIVREEGFRINTLKTRATRRGSRQMVTGLVVNDKVNIPRNKRKAWRAIFHQADLDPFSFKIRESELAGYYSMLKMVSPLDPALKRYKKVLNKLSTI